MRKETVTKVVGEGIRINENIYLEAGDVIHIEEKDEIVKELPENTRKETVTEDNVRINEMIILDEGDIIHIEEKEEEAKKKDEVKEAWFDDDEDDEYDDTEPEGYETLEEVLDGENIDYEVYDDYSGRGMFGSTTTGYTVECYDLEQIKKICNRNNISCRSDSLGLKCIVY